MNKKLTYVIILTAMITLTACGGSSRSSEAAAALDMVGATNSGATAGFGGGAPAGDFIYNDAMEKSSIETAQPESSNTESSAESIRTDDTIQLSDEKMVYRSSMTLETLNYTDDYNEIKNLIASISGIIQNESYQSYDQYVGYAYGAINARIPSKSYKEFTEKALNIGHLVNMDASADNITQQYYDKKARIDATQSEIDSVKNMLDECRSYSDYDAMLRLEDKLQELNYQLDSYKTELINMDTDVAYSYVNIELRDVTAYSSDNGREAFAMRWTKNWKDSTVGWLRVLEAIIFLVVRILPLIIIIIIIIVLIIRYKKLHPEKGIEKQEKNKQEQYDKYLMIMNAIKASGLDITSATTKDNNKAEESKTETKDAKVTEEIIDNKEED